LVSFFENLGYRPLKLQAPGHGSETISSSLKKNLGRNPGTAQHAKPTVADSPNCVRRQQPEVLQLPQEYVFIRTVIPDRRHPAYAVVQ
jgi:hypothetical protein